MEAEGSEAGQLLLHRQQHIGESWCRSQLQSTIRWVFGGWVNVSLPKLVKTVRSVPPGGALPLESQADKVHSHKLTNDVAASCCWLPTGQIQMR